MFPIKINGHVIGAKLNKTEQKALDIEVEKAVQAYFKNYENEQDAIVLWLLRDKYKFGEKRLRDFYFDYQKRIDDLLNNYELKKKDDKWICTRMLKEDGFDIARWREELDYERKYGYLKKENNHEESD